MERIVNAPLKVGIIVFRSSFSGFDGFAFKLAGDSQSSVISLHVDAVHTRVTQVVFD